MQSLQVGFIGLNETTLHSLRTLAQQAGYAPMTHICDELHLVCIGPFATEANIEHIERLKLVAIDEHEFLALTATTLIPLSLSVRLEHYRKHKHQAYRPSHGHLQHGLRCLHNIAVGISECNQLCNYNQLLLDIWLKCEPRYRLNSEYQELVNFVEDIVLTRSIQDKEIDDLLELIEDQLETVPLLDRYTCRGHSEFVQLHRIISKFESYAPKNHHNIVALEHWYTNYMEHLYSWPMSALTKDLQKIIKSKMIEDESKHRLLEKLKYLGEFSLPSQSHTISFDTCNHIDMVIPPNQATICFVGHFEYANRSAYEKKAIESGAQLARHPSETTQYIVVGGLTDLSEKHSSWYRKIERLRQNVFTDKGYQVVSETTWLAALKSHLNIA